MLHTMTTEEALELIERVGAATPIALEADRLAWLLSGTDLGDGLLVLGSDVALFHADGEPAPRIDYPTSRTARLARH